MRHQVEDSERPVGDLYITRRADVEEVPRMLEARDFALLWDPCASGAAPWTVGEILASAWGIPRVALSDLHPRRAGVREMNYLTTPRPRIAGPVLQVSNPPYYLIDEWLAHWRATALPGDACVWALAYDTFPVQTDRAQDLCRAILQPNHRLAFHLTEADARETGRMLSKSGRPRAVVDGLVELEATGKSHCWMVWQMRKPGVPFRRREHVLLGEPPIVLSDLDG